MTDTPEPRKGMPPVKLAEDEFRRRFLIQFTDPAFDGVAEELDRVADVAWDGYANSRKSPITRKAGPGYADPDYDLSVDWIAARAAIDAAQVRFEDKRLLPRILLVNGSSRSDHTCPGEMSKSFRLVQLAEEVCRAAGVEADILDLSRTVSEYGRHILPCKACFSTAAPLCHWPCSCYPNHSLGQSQDWMNDIYPQWVAADGVMIVTPVNWYQATSPLKALIDRLVCADGGNPDPTRTHGKDAKAAKEIELAGWDYPRHLAGRVFSLVVHGDVEGAEGVRRALADWLRAMDLVPAGGNAEMNGYIGYYEPYATNHEALDRDGAVQEEVRNAARTLVEAAKARRAGTLVVPGAKLKAPREK